MPPFFPVCCFTLAVKTSSQWSPETDENPEEGKMLTVLYEMNKFLCASVELGASLMNILTVKQNPVCSSAHVEDRTKE